MVANAAVGAAKDVMVKVKVAEGKRDLPGILAQAPCRADLAGSTMDLWPLYLFHPGAVTVNFAVSILTTCRITPLRGKEIHLRSLDGRREERGVRVAVFVAAAGRGRADVRRHGLRGDFDPVAVQMLVALLREFQLPQSGVDAHGDWVALPAAQDEWEARG